MPSVEAMTSTSAAGALMAVPCKHTHRLDQLITAHAWTHASDAELRAGVTLTLQGRGLHRLSKPAGRRTHGSA